VLPLAGAAAVIVVVAAGRVLVGTSGVVPQESVLPSAPAPTLQPAEVSPAAAAAAGEGMAPLPASPTEPPAEVTVVPPSAKPHSAAPPPAPVTTLPRKGPSPSAAAAASPTATAEPVAATAAANKPVVPQPKGTLRLRVLPWAEVTVDGTVAGTTPLAPLELAAGWHVVRLVHPEYRALEKRVEIRPGEVARIAVDLAQDSLRK
jgi:hypothetical protein